MQATLDEELDTIEHNSKGWSSLMYHDRTLLEKLSICLKSCLSVSLDITLLNLVNNQRPEAFDLFECIATHLFKQWYSQNRAFTDEQLSYLTTVGRFNRRLALTLQNDNTDMDEENEESETAKTHLENHVRVRELIFDLNNETYEILMEILPTMNKNEPNFIEMILPWYESYIFFERSYIDSTLDEKFLYFNQQIMKCLQSDDYKQCILSIDNTQTKMLTALHRFYIGICTMAMGVHVNCDTNECEDAKNLLEVYLLHYNNFINYFTTQKQYNSINSMACLTGIVTFLVNYTLVINNTNNRQLLIDLFSIILHEDFYTSISNCWSTYETVLIDSIVCYLIVYCFDDVLLIQNLLTTNEDYVSKLENLIEQAQACGNRRISIMTQLLLLILASSTTQKDLIQKLFLVCLNYIQISLQNVHSYHYNRIPMSLFFRSLTHIVKYDYIQEMIEAQYLELFTNIIINYERKRLYSNAIYDACTMSTLTILWSLSFNENIKKALKKNEKEFFNIIQHINETSHEAPIKQVTCGLLYNLDQLDLSECTSVKRRNSDTTVGISYDSSNRAIAEMIEQELSKHGLHVWTTYDNIDDNFVPSFISMMKNTKYFIVCLSDMYRLNNRCRTELLHATTSGHRVLSWKIHPPTNNPEENEQIRVHAVKTLLERIMPKQEENEKKVVPANIDTENIDVQIPERRIPTDIYRHRRAQEIMSLENWTNKEVVAWCESLNLPGFVKLLKDFDGQSVIRLYEFCKQNSSETISFLNHDLEKICEQENLPSIQISIYEFIRFQIEVEQIMPTKIFRKSSILMSTSKLDVYKGLKIKFCTLL